MLQPTKRRNGCSQRRLAQSKRTPPLVRGWQSLIVSAGLMYITSLQCNPAEVAHKMLDHPLYCLTSLWMIEQAMSV